MKLKRCPIPSHRGKVNCCGRASRFDRATPPVPKWKTIGPGVRQYPDGHVERTPAAMKHIKDRMIERGELCAACDQPFDDYREVELAHRISKGSGGWKRDDSTPNLVLMHKGSNRAQGSLPLDVYLRDYYKPSHCTGEAA